MKRVLSLLLVMCIVAPLFLHASANAAGMDAVLRIGLYFGNDALPAANLQNKTGFGSGYRFGYYDSTKQFIPLLTTDQVYLTIVKDKPMYLNGKEYFDVKPNSFTASIGPYHLELDTSYSTMNEAAMAAQQLNGAGLSAFPAYVNGTNKVRVGQYMSNEAAANAQGSVTAQTGLRASVVGNSKSCYTVTETGTNNILFEFDNGGTGLGIEPIHSGKAETWFKGYTYYGGFEYKRVNGNDITVINVVSQEDYIKGVIPYEMGPTWPVEALKVQAVCASSYAANCLGKHKAQGFDLCNTTDCQVYRGTKEATDNSDSAVEAVVGLYVLYNGRPAETYYHSSSGGYTEDAKNIWGNEVPYLKAVEDTYLEKILPFEFTITLSQMETILKSKGYSVSKITDFYVSKFTEAGNVRQITFVQSGGNNLVFTGEKARTILNNVITGIKVNSHRYTVSPNIGLSVSQSSLGGPTYAIGKDGVSAVDTSNLQVISSSGVSKAGGSASNYLVKGTGLGHNIGMSQWGVYSMSQKGFGYEEIVKFYYTGVEIGRLN